LHIRAVAHGLAVHEVPSFEAERIWGTSNLDTVRDGFRVLWSIAREWRRLRVDAVSRVPHTVSAQSTLRAAELPWSSTGGERAP
jgi:hypothetical protein